MDLKTSGWSALFLYAVSPGQVIRYLERQRQAGKIPESALLVSDAVAPTGLRVLLGDVAARVWMDTAGPTISSVFPSSPITLLWQSDADDTERASGYAIWKDGIESERGAIEAAITMRPGIIGRLLKAAAPDSPLLTWASQRQLPASRIPALRQRGPDIAIIDYDTVSRLDQKSLLVENSPRLYRFSV